MTTAILSGEKQCRGPCKRRLAPEAYRRSSKSADGREATCRDCRSARSPRAQGLELARRCEDARRAYLRRAITEADYHAVRNELAAWVERHGPVRAGDVIYGWRPRPESEMFRRLARR